MWLCFDDADIDDAVRLWWADNCEVDACNVLENYL